MPRGRLLVIAVLLLTALTGIPTSAAAEPPDCRVHHYLGEVLELRDSKPFDLHLDCGWLAESLEVAVTAPPQHGTVDPAAWDGDLHEHLITYDPVDSYVGPDQFTLSVSDGIDTAQVTVQLEIVPNTAPRCWVSYFTGESPVILHARVGAPAGAIMACEDFDIQDWYVLEPELAVAPEHGSVDFAPPSLDPSGPINMEVTYSPEAGYTGFDSFAVDVSDGALSDRLTFHVAVADGLWCVDPDPLHVDAGKTATTYTYCTDPDFNPYTLEVVDAPAQGTTAIEGQLIRYTADPDASGTDFFTFRATGATGHSNLVTQQVDVQPNAAPVCEPRKVRIAAGHVATPVLRCADDTPVSLAIASPPSHGELSEIVDGQVTYTPEPGFAGVDRFTYIGSDYARTSAPATVRITVDDGKAPVLRLGIAGGQTPRQVARRGLGYYSENDEQLTGTLVATVSGRTAKRLGLVRRANGPVLIATDRSRYDHDTGVLGLLHLTAGAAKAIQPARRVPLRLRFTGTDPTGETTTVVRRTTLRR